MFGTGWYPDLQVERGLATASPAARRRSSRRIQGIFIRRRLGFAAGIKHWQPINVVWTRVNPTSILMRYTQAGDADLDGQVGMTDFNALAGNFGGSGMYWWQGDMNYDGIVNALDLNAIAINWGQTGATPWWRWGR